MDIITDKKNAAIGILSGLCFILIFTLFGNILTPKCTSSSIPANTPKIAKTNANNNTDTSQGLPAPDIIKTATLYDISLNTPADQIDTLIAQSPFECRTNQQENKNPEGQIIDVQRFWRCNHKTYGKTSLSINVVNGKVMRLTRSGKATKEEILGAIASLDLLKLNMNSLKGFTMNQSERSTTFKLIHKKADNTNSSATYRMQFATVRDPENPPKHDGVLNVTLVR